MDEPLIDKHDQDESALEVGTRQAYREGLDSLDGATRSRLTQARYRALEELPKRRSVARWWVPAGAAASAVIMAWLLVSPGPNGTLQHALLAESTAIEILLGEDELEMLDELEFYAWIDELEELQGEFLDDGVG